MVRESITEVVSVQQLTKGRRCDQLPRVNPEAHEWLGAHGLRTPKSWPPTPQALAGLGAGRFILRGAPHEQRYRGLRTGEWIAKNVVQLAEAGESGSLVRVDEYIDALGGAAVVTGETVLVEVVYGQLSQLLGNGTLAARYVADSSSGRLRRGFAAGQHGTLGYPISERLGSVALDLNEVARKAIELTRSAPDRMLFEVLVDNSGVAFAVDAKRFPHMWNPQALLGGNSKPADEVVIGGQEADEIYVGPLTLESLPKVGPRTSIRLSGRALCAHFVTYSLDRGCAGVLR